MRSLLHSIGCIASLGLVGFAGPGGTPPTGAEFAVWLGCAWLAFGLVTAAVRFYREFIKEQPDPRATYVTKAEHAEHQAACDKRICNHMGRFDAAVTDLRRELADGRRADALSRKSIHEEIQEISVNMAAARADLDTLKQRDATAAMAAAFQRKSQSHDA